MRRRRFSALNMFREIQIRCIWLRVLILGLGSTINVWINKRVTVKICVKKRRVCTLKLFLWAWLKRKTYKTFQIQNMNVNWKALRKWPLWRTPVPLRSYIASNVKNRVFRRALFFTFFDFFTVLVYPTFFPIHTFFSDLGSWFSRILKAFSLVSIFRTIFTVSAHIFSHSRFSTFHLYPPIFPSLFYLCVQNKQTFTIR